MTNDDFMMTSFDVKFSEVFPVFSGFQNWGFPGFPKSAAGMAAENDGGKCRREIPAGNAGGKCRREMPAGNADGRWQRRRRNFFIFFEKF